MHLEGLTIAHARFAGASLVSYLTESTFAEQAVGMCAMIAVQKGCLKMEQSKGSQTDSLTLQRSRKIQSVALGSLKCLHALHLLAMLLLD
mmetsp:Transcript_31774/g.64209  ORF Transcript_31774/g.64209 Transcript_31774/m.64209 type:complete len:90 (-) Transcript_31774:1513-1782(-)